MTASLLAGPVAQECFSAGHRRSEGEMREGACRRAAIPTESESQRVSARKHQAGAAAACLVSNMTLRPRVDEGDGGDGSLFALNTKLLCSQMNMLCNGGGSTRAGD